MAAVDPPPEPEDECSPAEDPALWYRDIALLSAARNTVSQAVARRPVAVTCNIGLMSSTRDRVRQHRERLRRQGLRPVQIWVPDVRAPDFGVEAHRQSLAIAASEREADDQAFVDAISSRLDSDDEEAPPA